MLFGIIARRVPADGRKYGNPRQQGASELLRWPDLPPSRSWARARTGVSRLTGFTLSVVVLAVVSLAAIPAMIQAGGSAAWGAIALGQVIGTVGGVVVGYGWGWYGPARVAQSGPTERRREYVESVVVRGMLAAPVSCIAAAVAFALASHTPLYAAAGAVSATFLGLSASWYFVGLSKPYTMLMLDTLPRAAGTMAGVALMWNGQSAIMGPAGMFLGVLAALAISTIWVLRDATRAGAEAHKRSGLATVLNHNRHGITSAFCAAAYNAAPLAIVSLTAPSIQPAFAMADRVRGLVFVAAAPAATVLQGWVPRAARSAQVRRSNIALIIALAFSTSLGIGTFLIAPPLVGWLGNGEISLSTGAVALVSGCVFVTLIQSVLERAVLATMGRLNVAVAGVIAGSVVGLPSVALGAHQFGTAGAMGGVLVGLLVCIMIELVAYLYGSRKPTAAHVIGDGEG